MGSFILSIVLVGIFYAPLKFARHRAYAGQWKQWMRYAAGMCAWLAVVAVLLPFYSILKLFLDVMQHPTMGAGYEIAIVLILFSIIVKVVTGHPEILEFEVTRPFLQDLLRFKDLSRRRDDIFVEAEREQIKRIHKEQTGMDLALPGGLQQPAKHSPKAETKSPAPRLPFHLAQVEQDLQHLRNNEFVDITDTFRIVAMNTWSGIGYDHIIRLAIDPERRCLQCSEVFPKFTPAVRKDRERFFKFKQDVYDELQRITSLSILEKYMPFVDTIELQCYRVVENGFGLSGTTPFLTIGMACEELKCRENSVFLVDELDAVAKMEWQEEEE